MSEKEAWALALAAAVVLAVGVEEVPKVGVPLVALIVLVMLLAWKGWPNAVKL